MSQIRYTGTEIGFRIRRESFPEQNEVSGVSTGFAARVGSPVDYASATISPNAVRANHNSKEETIAAINTALRQINRKPSVIQDSSFRLDSKAILAQASDIFTLPPQKAEVDAAAALAVALTEGEPEAYVRLAKPIGAYAADAITVCWEEIVERDPVNGIMRLDSGLEIPLTQVFEINTVNA